MYCDYSRTQTVSLHATCNVTIHALYTQHVLSLWMRLDSDTCGAGRTPTWGSRRCSAAATPKPSALCSTDARLPDHTHICCSFQWRTMTPCCGSCHTYQYSATHCNTLQHTHICCPFKWRTMNPCCGSCHTYQYTATHCNTLQHTATRPHLLPFPVKDSSL